MPRRRCLECRGWAVAGGSRCPDHRRRRARARGTAHRRENAPALSAKLRARRGLCVYCGDPAEVWDHVVPLSKGGGELGLENLEPACRRCNVEKGELLLEEWRGVPLVELIRANVAGD